MVRAFIAAGVSEIHTFVTIVVDVGMSTGQFAAVSGAAYAKSCGEPTSDRATRIVVRSIAISGGVHNARRDGRSSL